MTDASGTNVGQLTWSRTTAGGFRAEIPEEPLDILFAGCSCVDYSTMNQNKPEGSVPALDRHLKQEPETNNASAGKGKAKAKKSSKGGNENTSAKETKITPLPVKLNNDFVKDLDSALDQLLRLPKGESARTFFAAVKLISVRRPKIVILENVYGAPWDMYTRQIFPMLNYVSSDVKLDSKEFYLPQTRQRGYLIALDVKHFGVEQATRIARDWNVQLAKSKRAPSAPVTAFLRPADDPSTVLARADMEVRGATNSEWALCSLRHADTRQRHGIRRDDNPFSKKAMRNDKLIFILCPAHSWLSYWLSRLPRIIDVMDIAFAVAYKAGVDLGYKTGMIDVSQNVDRNDFVLDSKTRVKNNLGIVGCITPSGAPIVTDMMRPITGTEALALQGLPVDELVISTESQSNLRDLAGNAMTVTVVGAVTLALLLAILKKGTTDPALLTQIKSAQPRRGPYLKSPQDDLLVAGGASGTTTNLDTLLAIARGMARLCYCPTPPDKKFLVCATCGITACSKCRGNPEHSFADQKINDARYSVEQGKVRLVDVLPKSLRLTVPDVVIKHGLKQVKEELYSSAVEDILTKGTVYYLDQLKVTEVVTVCYKAAKSIAHLVLSPNSACCWYIYIAPWHPDRAQLSSIFDVGQPVARGQLPSKSTAIPQWSVWAHGNIDLTLDLARDATGALIAGGLSFVDPGDAVRDASLLAWKTRVEGQVHGAYHHHPNCGTPGHALQVKKTSPTAAKVFMTWDSASLRDPDDDHFVWTEDVRRMEPHEYRETFLHAEYRETSPHPGKKLSWKLDSGLGTVGVFWPGYWSSPHEDLEESVAPQDPADLRWGSTETIQRAACHTDQRSPLTRMPILAAITAELHGFPALPARLSKMSAQQTGGRFHIVATTECDWFLKLFAFLFSELRRSRTPRDLARFPHLDGKWVTVASCQPCSVTPPEITVYSKDDQKASSEGDAKTTKAIIEDPDEAALFERQHQDLPRALAVAARFLRGNDGPSAIDARLMLQPKVLVSRAKVYLVQAHRTPARGRRSVESNTTTSFTVILNDALPSVAMFAPFIKSVRPCDEKYTAGIDVAKGFEVPVLGPPRFRRAFRIGNTMGRMQYELRPSQKDAVNWMLQREHAPLDFVKSEIEEEVVSPLNLRVLGKAEWVNRFPYSSRGGVVAHEIGYGKTVVTLALLDYMREFDENESIAERKDQVDRAWSQELPARLDRFGKGVKLAYPNAKAESFFVHLSATLVIVPRHITDQWAAEVKKFLGLVEPKIIVIKTLADFYGKIPLERLRKAEIIILSSAVFTETFLNRLQTIAGRGIDYPQGLSGRTREAWYRGALRNHRILSAFFLAGRDAGISEGELMETIHRDLLPGLEQKQKAEVDALVKKQVPEIDRRTHGKTAGKKVANPADDEGSNAEEDGGTDKKGKGGKQITKEATKTVEVWNIACLHNLSFARVVWDECSYDDDEYIHLFIANAVANAKWLISGTPKLFGLEQVCKIAAAFGIHVARPEPRMMPGLPAVTNGPELKPMSKSEEFHLYSSGVKSVSLAHERHAQGQMFVAASFRANALDTEIDIEFKEHVIPVDMVASNAIHYHLLNQELLDAGNDYTALPAHARAEVALKGSDLAGRDGPAAAKMMLGLLACGLGEHADSIDALEQDLAEQTDVLSDQMKLLWDKTMWLFNWTLALEPKHDSEYKRSDAFTSTSKRVGHMCNNLVEALQNDEFEDFGGQEQFRREAAIVAGLWRKQRHDSPNNHPSAESLQATWTRHFVRGWAANYNKNKALFTWLDFFDVQNSTLGRLTASQFRMLAEDICWLRYKINPAARPLDNGLPDIDFLDGALGPGSKTASRMIPAGIDGMIASDMRVLDGLDEEELKGFVRACVAKTPPKATWQQAKGTFEFKTDAGPAKAALQERLTELNLKFSSAHTVDKLKELLWRHQSGLGVCANYRDGRAPPDRYKDLPVLANSEGPVAKQLEPPNAELKRTMVHLAKTVEDLRATRLEANFVPEYSSLAGAESKDGVVQAKLCGGCKQPLASASLSFLVVACGHFLCDKCKPETGFFCPVKDCPAFIRHRPVLQCSQVPQQSPGGPLTKAQCVADHIWFHIPQGESVVVFAQYGPLLKALADAFEIAHLGFTNLAATADSMISNALETFKSGHGGQILLLDMDSETSAGSNLTIANHVIFASPYVHADKEHQSRTVRQARGRCIRTGQTKKVHVYHFMVPETIEDQTLREFGRDSPAVKRYFANSGSKPWWLKEKKEEEEEEESNADGGEESHEEEGGGGVDLMEVVEDDGEADGTAGNNEAEAAEDSVPDAEFWRETDSSTGDEAGDGDLMEVDN
jgi:site-specific DNA-cytosine methylase